MSERVFDHAHLLKPHPLPFSHRIFFDRGAGATGAKVRVDPTQYQPINISRGTATTATITTTGASSRQGPSYEEDLRARRPGNPSLVRVLIKTFGFQFVLSIFFKLTSDLLAFANPLILK